MIGKMTNERFGTRGELPNATVWLLIALGLLLFWLVVVVAVSAVLDTAGQQPSRMPLKIDAGIAASGTRWTALGEYYTSKRAGAAADAGSARYRALAGYHSAGQDRWAALGDYYTGKRAEAAAEAAAARYQALGEHYRPKGWAQWPELGSFYLSRQAGTSKPVPSGWDRWAALGEFYRTRRAEAAADAASARYQALGDFYTANLWAAGSRRYPCDDCVNLATTGASDQVA